MGKRPNSKFVVIGGIEQEQSKKIDVGDAQQLAPNNQNSTFVILEKCQTQRFLFRIFNYNRFSNPRNFRALQRHIPKLNSVIPKATGHT